MSKVQKHQHLTSKEWLSKHGRTSGQNRTRFQRLLPPARPVKIETEQPNRTGIGIMKKIAVPSDDGTFIAAHFGRSAFFLVFETENGKVVRKEVRGNAQGGGQPGECHSADGHDHAHGHDHATMGEILQDCEAILCGGMGWRAAEALNAFGIEPLMVQTELPAQQAVEAYLAGSLPTGTGFCRCHH
jgi:predicted Fe-Mo cluster-binding NifX family protein